MKVENYPVVLEEILFRVHERGEIQLNMVDEKALRKAKNTMKNFCKALIREGKRKHGVVCDYAATTEIKQCGLNLIIRSTETSVQVCLERSLKSLLDETLLHTSLDKAFKELS